MTQMMRVKKKNKNKKEEAESVQYCNESNRKDECVGGWEVKKKEVTHVSYAHIFYRRLIDVSC